MGNKIADVRAEVEAVHKAVEGVEGKVKIIESGTNQIVMFGIYLMCITFIALFLTTILNVINTKDGVAKIEELHRLVVDHGMGLLASILILLGVGAIMFIIIRAVGKLVRLFMK